MREKRVITYRMWEPLMPRGSRDLLDIPIYLRTKEEYQRQAFTKMENSRAESRAAWALVPRERLGEINPEDEIRKIAPDCPIWRYNDIVGYLRVWYDGGTRIVVDGYLPYKRLYILLRDRRLRWVGKLSEIRIDPRDNASLRQGILDGVKDAITQLSGRRLYVQFDPDLVEALDVAMLVQQAWSVAQ